MTNPAARDLWLDAVGFIQAVSRNDREGARAVSWPHREEWDAFLWLVGRIGYLGILGTGADVDVVLDKLRVIALSDPP